MTYEWINVQVLVTSLLGAFGFWVLGVFSDGVRVRLRQWVGDGGAAKARSVEIAKDVAELVKALTGRIGEPEATSTYLQWEEHSAAMARSGRPAHNRPAAFRHYVKKHRGIDL